jgi:hypothetical protein
MSKVKVSCRAEGHIIDENQDVAPATPRTTHMSFAECFAALKEIVGDRADRTLKIEVTAWQHNAIPDTEMNWSAWVGCISRAITAPTPESLVARVRAAIDGKDSMSIDDVRLGA